MPEVAPGPPGDPLVGHLRPFRRDVLALLLSAARDHGDVVRFRIGPHVVHLVNHPDHVTHVLQSHARQYDKATRSTAALRLVAGTSLLTTNGAAWEARRRIVQPAFHRQRVGALAGVMTEVVAARVASWRAGDSIDVASEMMRVAFAVAGRALLGADVDAAARGLEPDVTRVIAHAFTRWSQLLPVPASLPTPANRAFARALARIDRVVADIVRTARDPAGQRPPLLATLLDAVHPDTGAPFSDAQLRDEVITMLLAGHETTASALSWTFALLATHPEVAGEVGAEIEAVLGGRTPTLDDVSSLRVTSQVVHEALRLYPPIWAIERRAVVADTIAGYPIPAGSSVIVSPYVLHRHPTYWRDPEHFDPSRFTGAKLPDAYLPFGAGPRYCIGAEFALLEARLVVAMVVQRWRLTLAPGHVIAPLPGLTLRLRHGLRMTVTPR